MFEIKHRTEKLWVKTSDQLTCRTVPLLKPMLEQQGKDSLITIMWEHSLDPAQIKVGVISQPGSVKGVNVGRGPCTLFD